MSQPQESDLSQPDSVPAPDSKTLASIVLHQALFRCAWIFKTESVLMPAFLDTLTGSGFIRGLLPPLNRFCQSFVPLLLSGHLQRAPLKSAWLARTTLLMGCPFLLIGTIEHFRTGPASSWFAAVFLLAYATFFCLHGTNLATYNTLQGKLIPANQRGRLMMWVGYLGSPSAVLLAWWLLQKWTMATPPRFDLIFLFTGATFVTASFAARLIKETPDHSTELKQKGSVFAERFSAAWSAFQSDRHLRRLCGLSAMFASSQMLFPHYQALGRAIEGYEGRMLMIWVVGQNVSAAVFSWISGWNADRRGTRSSLRGLLFAAIFAPWLALLFNQFSSAGWYWVTFAWLGTVPVAYRMQLNYVLELTDRSQHPIYVSTAVISMAMPMLLSPLVGAWIQQTSFLIPFACVSVVVAGAWVMSLLMIEPRHCSPEESTEVDGSSSDESKAAKTSRRS